MILADDEAGRRRALAKLLPMQRQDFKGIFEIMGELPVTIRTLDPPLHEFLPNREEEIGELADVMNVPVQTLREKVKVLHEFNPMLGHHGCRLGISYPEITEMQAQAIFEAACGAPSEAGKHPFPEVMIPLRQFTRGAQGSAGDRGSRCEGDDESRQCESPVPGGNHD